MIDDLRLLIVIVFSLIIGAAISSLVFTQEEESRNPFWEYMEGQVITDLGKYIFVGDIPPGFIRYDMENKLVQIDLWRCKESPNSIQGNLIEYDCSESSEGI